MSSKLLNMISHANVDILINRQLLEIYKKHQTMIELKYADDLFLGLTYNRYDYIENMLLANYVVRKICDRSNAILQEEKEQSDYKNMRDDLCLKYFGFSFFKLENIIIQIILIRLDELLDEEKYIYYEELDAVAQYFKSQSSNFGVDLEILSQLIDKRITIYQQENVDKLKNCVKRGKNVFLSLRYFEIIDKELLYKSINKNFDLSISVS